MKAITIWQPWASLIACGAKKYETRSWLTSYRGPIAIHAASTDVFDVLKLVPASMALKITEELHCSWDELPKGAVIATARLVNVWAIIRIPQSNNGIAGRLITPETRFDKEGRLIVPNEREVSFGDWTPGRYAWEFSDVKMLKNSIKASGKQRFWNWDPTSDIL